MPGTILVAAPRRWCAGGDRAVEVVERALPAGETGSELSRTTIAFRAGVPSSSPVGTIAA